MGYGYILKSDYGISDKEGLIADVHIPKTKKVDYDLSKSVLSPKYKTEIKLNLLKIDDLKCLAAYTEGEHKRWWTDFFSRQEELVNFDDNDADSVEMDPEVNDTVAS